MLVNKRSHHAWRNAVGKNQQMNIDQMVGEEIKKILKGIEAAL